MPNTDVESGTATSGTGTPQTSGSPVRLSDRQDGGRQWTLKGLAPATVEVSRDAARRSGMKLNAWVSRALEQAAMTPNISTNDKSAPLSASGPDTIQHLREEVVRLRAQSDDMRRTMDTMNTILLKLCADRI